VVRLRNKILISLSLLSLVIISLVGFALLPVKAQESGHRYDLIIVRNDDLIDYIVALPYSKKLDIPILPVNPQMLDDKTKAQLQSYVQFGWKNVLIIGNSNAVSKEVEDELLSLGFSVTRIGGDVRTETAEKLALHFYPDGADTVVLASALDYGSALAAARFAMNYGYPLLLTLENDLSEFAIEGLKRLHPKQVIMIGAGLSPEIEKKLEEMGYSVFWYGKNVTITITPPKEPSPIPWVVIGAVISLVITVPIILYWAKKKWAANRVPIEVLTEKERIVVKAILERGGKVKQEELPELTGYSRPTVSRIVQELEKKQLVTREKVGKTFIVKLIKEINLKE